MDNNAENNGIDAQMSPADYFEILKGKRNNITDNDLCGIYDNCLKLMQKYLVTGQVKGAKKLMFHLETIEKERDIVKAGIDTFVYKDDIEYYIDNIANDIVKIIELERYEREIPDDIVDAVALVKDKFDIFYVVFTDYTGSEERKAIEERKIVEKEKDPILFGAFLDRGSLTIVDRFYYIGDWEDEYCDLTLDKMVSQFKDNGNGNIVKSISTPKTIAELKAQLNTLEQSTSDRFRVENPLVVEDVAQDKKGFFSKIKSFIKRER